jgi:hypothetical protein
MGSWPLAAGIWLPVQGFRVLGSKVEGLVVLSFDT